MKRIAKVVASIIALVVVVLLVGPVFSFIIDFLFTAFMKG